MYQIEMTKRCLMRGVSKQCKIQKDGGIREDFSEEGSRCESGETRWQWREKPKLGKNVTHSGNYKRSSGRMRNKCVAFLLCTEAFQPMFRTVRPIKKVLSRGTGKSV